MVTTEKTPLFSKSQGKTLILWRLGGNPLCSFIVKRTFVQQSFFAKHRNSRSRFYLTVTLLPFSHEVTLQRPAMKQKGIKCHDSGIQNPTSRVLFFSFVTQRTQYSLPFDFRLRLQKTTSAAVQDILKKGLKVDTPQWKKVSAINVITRQSSVSETYCDLSQSCWADFLPLCRLGVVVSSTIALWRKVAIC